MQIQIKMTYADVRRISVALVRQRRRRNSLNIQICYCPPRHAKDAERTADIGLAAAKGGRGNAAMAAQPRSSSRSYPRLLVCTDYDFVRNGYPHSREGERQTDRRTEKRESSVVWPFAHKQVGLRLDWLLLHRCLVWSLSFLDPLARPLALPFSGSLMQTTAYDIDM